MIRKSSRARSRLSSINNMKYIFDFDDVLFRNTEMFKPRMFGLIADAGVPREEVEKDYSRPEVRWQQFSLKRFIKRMFETHTAMLVPGADPEKVYANIMSEAHNFLNTKLIDEIKKIGPENCYIVTNGEYAFNHDKLSSSGILRVIDEKNVRIVPDDKGDAIEEICKKYGGENVIFIDDKPRFIEELQARKIENLKTILYIGNDLDLISSGGML